MQLKKTFDRGKNPKKFDPGLLCLAYAYFFCSVPPCPRRIRQAQKQEHSADVDTMAVKVLDSVVNAKDSAP